MADNYIGLHVHSDFSRLDSVAKVGLLVKKAKSLGMPALALTDHGTISGWIKFYEECTKHEIKPIFGIEAYICKNHILHKEIDQEILELEEKVKNYMPLFDGLMDDPEKTMAALKKKKIKNRKANHVIILAKNEVGYHNIIQLSSIAFTEGQYYKPRIDMKLLEQYKEGLIVTSACLGGQISSCILKDDYHGAEKYVKEYKRIFGEDFYIELQLHPVEEQVKANKVLIELANKFDIKTIISQDVHYVEAADVDLHEVVIRLKNKDKDKSLKKDGDIPREVDLQRDVHKIGGKRSAIIYEQKMREFITAEKSSVDSDGYFYNAREYYFKSYQELKNSWQKSHSYITEETFNNSIDNTFEIANKVERVTAHSIVAHLPKFGSDTETPEEMFKRIVKEGAKTKLAPKISKNLELKEVYNKRLHEEFDTILDLGFAEYFLIVWDFIIWSRRNGITVGPGRGSVGGSLIAYCMDIIKIDPIQHGLYFARFINKTRSSAKYKIAFNEKQLVKK